MWTAVLYPTLKRKIVTVRGKWKKWHIAPKMLPDRKLWLLQPKQFYQFWCPFRSKVTLPDQFCSSLMRSSVYVGIYLVHLRSRNGGVFFWERPPSTSVASNLGLHWLIPGLWFICVLNVSLVLDFAPRDVSLNVSKFNFLKNPTNSTQLTSLSSISWCFQLICSCNVTLFCF